LRGATLGAVLFAALVLLSIGAFAIERAARSSDDVVNTVVLESNLQGGRIEFTLARPDGDVDVLIIEGNEGSDGEVVRTLEAGAALEAGRHVYRWDGRDDEGSRAPPGLYAIEVVLGEQDRDVRPPGRIEVSDRGYTLDFGEQP
jgi:flagellar hook assembly protein FlgD